MRAGEHTARMLSWQCQRGVAWVDLAVRRACGTLCWHHHVAIEALPLPWMRAENVRGGNVYIRPARDHAWPLLFLDDVDRRTAVRVASFYDALVVHTSHAGGCHIWLCCVPAIGEAQRAVAQRYLAARIGADSRSTSGDHLGRLAGFRNWKRSGEWVNVLPVSPGRPPWNVEALLACNASQSRMRPQGISSAPASGATASRDTSESGKEWGWTCGALDAGMPPVEVVARLTERALVRRGRGAFAYAKRTVAKALSRRS